MSTVASLLNGLATSSEFLIASRALQGLGAAMVSPAALSIVTIPMIAIYVIFHRQVIQGVTEGTTR